MQSVTRRTALKGTGADIAVTAASVPMLAAQGNPDARVFALIEERGVAVRLRRPSGTATSFNMSAKAAGQFAFGRTSQN